MAENTFIKPIPSVTDAFKTLLRADFKIQWRQRKAFLMSLLMPLIFLFSWKGLIPIMGAENVLAICIASALPSTGLMGYSQTVARDREKGIFQRLRAAPIPTWAIMTSRIIVQLVVIVVITLCTYAFGYFVDKIYLDPGRLLLTLIAALVGGLSFIALGQFIVAFIKGSEAVNAAARLIYIPLVVVGALGAIGLFGEVVKNIVTWSPFGTTQMLLAAAMHPAAIDSNVLWAFLATLGYGIFFAGVGMKYFRWTEN